MTCCGFRPLSGSYISQYSFAFLFLYQFLTVSVPYRGATFLNEVFKYYKKKNKPVSVPYRGATFLNNIFRLSTDKKDILFPSPIGELHFSIGKIISGPLVNDCFRPLSGSYISQLFAHPLLLRIHNSFRPLSGSYISQLELGILYSGNSIVSVPYRGATFLNNRNIPVLLAIKRFRPLSGSYISQLFAHPLLLRIHNSFRPLSGSYISQYHPRNPMSCLGRIGGLRGKSNFIEMQPFWKVKNSHKSSI